jgi:NodT family efflux transporter outer membrane factor (OMF) lipoprotein
MSGDKAPAEAALTAGDHPAGPWWRALGSARLDAVMDEALAGNQTVAGAVANLEKAQDQVASASGALAPQVTGNAAAERERINIASFGFTGFPNPTINLFSVGAAVNYDLDLFGGGRRRVETARAVAEAQGHRADAAYLTLTGNVALQAVRVAGVHSQIEAVEAIIADDQRNLDIIHRAQAAGGEAPAASTGGQAQLAADQALLPPLAQQLSQARHALAQLVGKSPSEWAAPDFTVAEFAPPAAIPVSLPSTLVRRRPDILAAEADLHADTARIGVATADLYPDIKLGAAFTQSALTPGNLFSYNATGWNFGPSLTLPIFNGGHLRAEKHAAEAQARASLAQYRQTVLTAFTQVSDVMTALGHDDEAIHAAGAAEDAAQAALNDARKAYSLGGGPLSSVVEAQRQLSRARLQLAQVQAQRLMDIIELYAATAADWRSHAA